MAPLTLLREFDMVVSVPLNRVRAIFVLALSLESIIQQKHGGVLAPLAFSMIVSEHTLIKDGII